MSHLIHEQLARARAEEYERRGREALRRGEQHRQQVERVRASVILVPRRPRDVRQEG